MNKGDTLNIIYHRSAPLQARLLSALINRPFQMPETNCTTAGNLRWFASLEGWYQGIKFPLHDPRRYEAFASSFGYAKAFSKLAERQYVWWGTEQMKYAGANHRKLIEAAFRASFVPGSDRMQALLETDGLVLTHETGEPDAPDSPLTKAEFGPLLMKIRHEILERMILR